MSRTWKIRGVAILVAAGVFLSMAPRIAAVVNQIDGTLIPVQTGTPCPGEMWSCLQTGLNYGEGLSTGVPAPGQPNPIDAVFDANTGPETFLVPKNGSSFVTVNFRLLQEGAGFENIFGWYNVGEPNIRFPAVPSCYDGKRSTYEPAEESGGVISGEYIFHIDFQAEYVAGRYKGKQIGFYLVTPEGSYNRSNDYFKGVYVRSCATDPDDQGTLTSGGPLDDDHVDEADGHDDDNGFGRIYYTESKLNNDGNYVHYLVYRSKANPDHFYFGFEDLFRGGDNDYEDTMVKVEGLVPTCQPSTEICNGVDDNCNSQVDENLFRPCASACGTGQESCAFTNDGNANNDWVGCTAPKPTTEICNGLDDDCDGSIDENLVGGACTSTEGCLGTKVCQKGAWACDAPAKTKEVCDGKDNDCDGVVDEGVTRPCASICGTGIETCHFTNDGDPSNDWTGCTAPVPGTETCNGVDDDCDGSIDNNLPPAKTCTVGGCLGKYRCVGGKEACDAPIPGEEICDGLDNNCNGKVDEGLVRSCATSCGFGSEHCAFIDDGDPSNDWTGCTAAQPEPEVCDGVDNDCNGKVDDAAAGSSLAGEGVPCDHPSGHTCKKGLTKCVGGKIACVGATPGFGEICDCKDNDCDGDIDEGDDLCPANTKCVACGCRIPCSGGEFGCPQGFACSKGYCIPDQCVGVHCKGEERCVDGKCVDPCAGVHCQHDEVCIAGACVGDNCYGRGCPAGQVCLKNACQAPPCAGVTCGAGEYCKDGVCKKSCGGALCGAGARCEDGVCMSDPCAGVTCAQGIRCIAGVCDTACDSVTCGAGRYCVKGACVDDPCLSVRCFAGERCEEGQCISASTFAGSRVDLLATGSGGFACAVGTSSRERDLNGVLPLLLLLGLSVMWRRRRDEENPHGDVSKEVR